MSDAALIIYQHGDRWYIGEYDLTTRRMFCHIGRQDRGYATRDAATHDLSRLVRATAGRYRWWENGGLDWEAAGL
jgi:hypothetical protein